MYECLACKVKFKSKLALGCHVKVHGLTIVEYDTKFGLDLHCISCGKKLDRDYTYTTYMCHSCCAHSRVGEKNGFYKKSHSDQTKQTLSKLNVEATKQKWLDPEYREKIIKGVSKPRPESFKLEQSKRITQWYIDNPHQRTIRSGHMKKSWTEGKIVPNSYASNDSHLERELYDFVKTIDNHMLRKQTLHIGTKWFLPDMIHETKSIIIEFFGDHWHCNPKLYLEDYSPYPRMTAKGVWEDDKRRLDILTENGYSVLIVWEHDFLYNRPLVETQVIDFLNNQ